MKKMTCRSRTPTYTPYPHFLKDIPIGDTPRLVYAFLFGRAQMSQSHGWEDESGVYIYYPIAAIARDCGKCAMTVKTALNALEKADLIARKRMGVGRANKIYVHIPETADCPLGRQAAVHPKDDPLSTNYREELLDSNYYFQEGESL